jgi:elongation factor G
VLCPNRDKKENVAQLWQIHATKKERDGQIDSVSAGDICCVIGPRFAITGDTLCDTEPIIELPSIKFAETVLSMAIEPESTGDQKEARTKRWRCCGARTRRSARSKTKRPGRR